MRECVCVCPHKHALSAERERVSFSESEFSISFSESIKIDSEKDIENWYSAASEKAEKWSNTHIVYKNIPNTFTAKFSHF